MNSKLITVPTYGNQCVTIDNLTTEEIVRLRASMLSGHHWVRRGHDGRLEHVPSYENLPDPIKDEEMFPFWRKPTKGEARQIDMFGFDPSTEATLKHASPSIYITSLCGYDYSAENYKLQAVQLTEWGFICMRSPRDDDGGMFWEVWFLPGVWATRGLLKETLDASEAQDGEDKFNFILEFLRHNASFGSLDVSIQRMAMVIDD